MLEIGAGESRDVVLPDELLHKDVAILDIAEHVPGKRNNERSAGEDKQIRPAPAGHPQQRRDQHQRDQAFCEHGES